MVWIKYKEKYHGKTSEFWKNKKSLRVARLEVKKWNQFSNPYEKLSIVKTTTTRPKGITKTRYRGIYK